MPIETTGPEAEPDGVVMVWPLELGATGVGAGFVELPPLPLLLLSPLWVTGPVDVVGVGVVCVPPELAGGADVTVTGVIGMSVFSLSAGIVELVPVTSVAGVVVVVVAPDESDFGSPDWSFPFEFVFVSVFASVFVLSFVDGCACCCCCCCVVVVGADEAGVCATGVGAECCGSLCCCGAGCSAGAAGAAGSGAGAVVSGAAVCATAAAVVAAAPACTAVPLCSRFPAAGP